MSSLQPFFTNYNYTILKALIIKHPSFLLFSTRAVIVVVEWRERERERESLLWKMRFRFEEEYLYTRNKDILRRRRTGDIRFGFI
jgi:hypothetical protein